MTILTKRVELYKRTGAEGALSWSSTAIVINDTLNVRVDTGLGNKKDIFSFNLTNYANLTKIGNDKEKGDFDIGDNIKIYFNQDSFTFGSNQLAIDGIITEINETISDSGRTITIEGKSRTEIMLEGLVTVVDARGLTPPEIVRLVIDDLNANSTEGGSTVTINYDGTSIPSLKSDGSSHSTYQFFESYKNAQIIIEKLSSVEYTKDPRGNYIYYLDNQNRFFFTYRSSTIAFTITEGSTNGLSQIKITRKTDGIVNSLVINAGSGADGKGIQFPLFDHPSRQRYGAKWRYVTSTTNTAQDLMTGEINNNPTSFDDTNGFIPNSFPYTTYWKSIETDGDNAPFTTANTTLTVSNKAQYVFSVKRESTNRAKAVGRAIINLYSNPRIKADLEFVRTMVYSIGDLILLTAPSYNLTDRKLRIIEISHDDYKTNIKLEEDEATIDTD